MKRSVECIAAAVDTPSAPAVDAPSAFQPTAASAATSLLSCAKLPGHVLMPWVGFGTYKLGASTAREATRKALAVGYRAIDTAYIYSGEKTEGEVGKALAAAVAAGSLSRDEVFITTKHWRKFHGYAPALGCLERSLSRLQLSHVDLWLMHWPGPAWCTMNRKTSELQEHGPWHCARVHRVRARRAAHPSPRPQTPPQTPSRAWERPTCRRCARRPGAQWRRRCAWARRAPSA